MGSRDRANPHDRRAARGWFLTRRTRRARRKTGRASVAGLDMSAPIPPTATRSFGARTRADGDPFGGMAGGTAASRLSASKLLLQGFCFKAPASRLPLRGFLLRGSLRDLRVLRVRKEPALPVRGDWVHPPEILKRLVSHEAHGERAASWGDPAPLEMPRAGPAGAPTVSPDLRDSIGRRTARKKDRRRALSTTTPPRVPYPP